MTTRSKKNASLELLEFIPFRLNRLAAEVSNHLAEIYRDRFKLEIAEWRVLATLGPEQACTAQFIVDSTRTHKTRISRAITNLEERGLVERVPNTNDRRELKLKLSRAGRGLYNQIVPVVLERERLLLACLSKAELQGLVTGLARLEESLQLTGGEE